jgi:hypothetical protein
VGVRCSRFCLIIALPDGRTADKAADALADRILTLPGALRRTLIAWALQAAQAYVRNIDLQIIPNGRSLLRALYRCLVCRSGGVQNRQPSPGLPACPGCNGRRSRRSRR